MEALFRTACPSCSAPVTSRKLQTLWGGMGAVHEVSADTGHAVVVKRIDLPADSPALSEGDRRKRLSYLCETSFYAHFAASAISAGALVPQHLHHEFSADGRVLSIVMSRLEPCRSVTVEEAAEWLARFHALHWGAARCDAAVAGGLQAQGCYWYLDTRIGEWEGIGERGLSGRLRAAARAIDTRLRASSMLPTVCHGDAKAANMLRGAAGELAMCDFQYCGKASCGKDIAYMLTCALDGGAAVEARFLAAYLDQLRCALAASRAAGGGADTPPSAPPPTEAQLRAALDLSYCDLYRWMLGWGCWGNAGELEAKVARVVTKIDGGTRLASAAAYDAAVAAAFPGA